MTSHETKTENQFQHLSYDALVAELSENGIIDPKVLSAFREVHRVDFVPSELSFAANNDEPVAIGHGQVTSQPSLIALMIQELALRGDEKVLEIGTGYGFQTAILSRLCRQVFSIERIKALAETAKENLKKGGISNAHVIVGDGNLGLPQKAPFDAVIVSAAAPHVPEALTDQLVEEGRIVQPIGPGGNEVVTLFRKRNGKLTNEKEITLACFVPLR